MNLMHPLILLGALGIGIPILAHLLNKHQYKQTDWAAMQFLNKAVRVRSRQIRIRDLILLLLRCLAILLLVFALSRPSFDNGSLGSVIKGENRAGVIIALDTSFSMQHNDGTGSRFERAVEEIDAICQNINPGDPISLILLGDEHRVIVRNMAYNSERFGAILHEQKAGPEELKMETVFGELSRLTADMEAIQKEIYIVTDMQNRDWKNASPWLINSLKNLNEQAYTFILPVQGNADNLSVTDLELVSGVLRKGTVARYSATVRNNGIKPATNVLVKCLINGINADSKAIPVISPKSSQTVSFFVPFHNSGSVKITAELKKDALPLDNIRRTVANIRQRVSILCVEGKSYGNSLESFITKALKARGESSGKEDFRVMPVSWLSLPSQNLDNYDIVILSNVPEITKEQAKKLRDYVKAGNGLIWFGGENVKSAVWNERSKVEEDGYLLPASIGDIESVSDESGAGRPIDPVLGDHPICRPLRSLPKDLLSETSFHKLLTIEPLSTSNVVLNLSGNSVPLLIEHSIGRGHVFMFNTSSNPSWNNMALTPSFPMLMQQMVTYLSGREFEKSRLVGSSLSLSYPDRPDANDGVFETPSGKTIKVPVRNHGNQYVAFLEHAREAGFYQARVSVQSPGRPIAVNVNTQESDVECLSPEKGQAELEESGVIVARSTADLLGSVNDVRTKYEYWRALMIAGLAILVIESIVASNLFRRKAAKKTTISEAA